MTYLEEVTDRLVELVNQVETFELEPTPEQLGSLLRVVRRVADADLLPEDDERLAILWRERVTVRRPA